MTAVVTELVIDSTGAEDGAASFADAMAKASKASNDNLKSIADNTAALNKQISGLGDATQAATESSSSHWGSFVAKLAIGALAAAAGLSALYMAFKVLYEIVTLGPKLLGEAWDLGSAKLAEYVALSKEAVAVGLTPEWFQRITKSALDSGTSIDIMTASLKKLNDATAPKLGGSTMQSTTDPLQTAGNFKGNTGVMQLQTANSTLESLRAVVSLWDQAVAKGEKLAGIQVVQVALGDEMAKKFWEQNDYGDKILADAEAISKQKLISDLDVANAEALQNRLDAAMKILEQRWHPVQDVLTAGGIKMKEAWVSILETVASVFDGIMNLINKIPAAFWTLVAKAGAVVGYVGGLLPGPFGAPLVAAGAVNQYVGGKMGDTTPPAEMYGPGPAEAAAQKVMNDRNKDTSKPLEPDPNKPDPASTDAYDTATQAIKRYTEVSKAAALTVSDNVGEQEKFKAIAQLTAAGIKDGLTPAAAAAKAQMEGLALATEAGAAALALAKAKINNEISFGSKTSLLSSEDVQIATQLKTIYPDVATALNSVQAAGIRTNNAMKGLANAIETNLTTGLTDIAMGTKTASQGFKDMSLAVIRALEEMMIKALIVKPIMDSLQHSVSGSGILSFLHIGASNATDGIGGFGPTAPGSAHGNVFSGGNIIPFARGGVVDSPTIAPMALFGEAGPEAIIPLRRGPDGNLGVGGGGGSINAPVTINIDATGADPAGLARVQQQLASLQATLPSTIVLTVQKAKSNRITGL